MPPKIKQHDVNTDGELFNAVATVDDRGEQNGILDRPFYIGLGDGAAIDAFSRLRTSNPYAIFDASFVYGKQTHLFTEVVANGGAVTNDTPNASQVLSVTAAVGSKAGNYSSERIHYQPGRSLLTIFTGNFNGHTAGITKRIGLFDDDDGLYFYSDGTEMGVCLRSSVSGAPLETKIPQSSWNIDRLDGTNSVETVNESGILLNPAKSQIFLIDFQWLGAGRIRFGLNIDGKFIYVHEILNANNIDTVYMSNPSLFMAYEIENVTGANTGTLNQICCSAFSEGGYEKRGFLKSRSTELVSVPLSQTPGVLTPVLSIRPKSLFKGVTNKSTMIALDINIMAENNTVHWAILEDAIIRAAGQGAIVSYTDNGTESVAEYHINTGGTAERSTTPGEEGREILEGYLASGGVVKAQTQGSQEIGFKMIINPDGHHDSITIAATSDTGLVGVMYAAITWREIRT